MVTVINGPRASVMGSQGPVNPEDGPGLPAEPPIAHKTRSPKTYQGSQRISTLLDYCPAGVRRWVRVAGKDYEIIQLN